VVNKALVIAHGVHETGRREILSIDVGEAETEAFWTDFLRGLVVVPEQVVHPGLLGGWWLLRPPVPRRTPDEVAR
jgi:hypothetical protein